MFATKKQFFTKTGGYQISKSLRFRASATAYLTRTFGTPTNNKVWTWSAWVKRGSLSLADANHLFMASPQDVGSNPTTYTRLIFETDNTLTLQSNNSAGELFASSAVYRDASAWYHIVLYMDAVNTTVRCYVNGTEISYASRTNPTNTNTAINASGNYHRMGLFRTAEPRCFDGYMAEVNFIDGQALTPSSFGAIDANGVWSPIQYTGTYGANGFYLPFTDNSGVTATTIGKDNASIGGTHTAANNWTPNNISLASASYTSYTSGSGNYTVPAGVTSINYLVVAGGGGGAGSYGGLVANGGGGGGAGGVLYGTMTVTPGQTIAYSVGAGGTGSADGSTAATSGANTTFGSYTAIGGGRGGNAGGAASSGGSGGGGAADSPNQTGASGTSGQGTSGGNGTTTGAARAGGGGGATTAGATGLASGNGGAGYTWINGTTYGGGGGGGAWSSQGGGAGTGGSGGGGAGGTSGDGTAGTANTGGGGGGGGAPAGSSAATAGGNGGSGIVIIGVGAGVTYDSMIDSPTNAASGTQPVGNYCVLNPIDKGTSGTISAANLQWAYSAAAWNGIRSTFAIPLTGQWYWEATVLGTYCDIGIATSVANLNSSGYNDAYCYSYGSANADIRYGGATQATVATYTTNDVIAYYINAGVVKVYKNNSLIATWSQNLSAYSGQYFPAIYCNTNSAGVAVNFGQRPFVYTPPGSALALCTANLATPTIKSGAQYMAATTYTGTGATQTIANTVNGKSFKPDLVWIKSRSAATNNNLFDAIRGTTNYLISNSTAANASNVNTLTAFGSTGFTLGSDASSIGVNVNAATYVGWQWLAGSGTTSSNPNGSITSTVCVNTTSGFSVVTYTGNATSGATVGHGLGVAPSMMIVKDYANVRSWSVYHTSIGAANVMYLNQTVASGASTEWNSVAPSSSVFTLGNPVTSNASGATYVAYCWAPITGYSAFGSYTGNGSTDGPFVYLGFRPRFIIIKGSSFISNWFIEDSARNGYNVNSGVALRPNLSNAEDGTTTYDLDILSNGFKMRSSAADSNTNAATFIYAAFAENPFNISRAR